MWTYVMCLSRRNKTGYKIQFHITLRPSTYHICKWIRFRSKWYTEIIKLDTLNSNWMKFNLVWLRNERWTKMKKRKKSKQTKSRYSEVSVNASIHLSMNIKRKSRFHMPSAISHPMNSPKKCIRLNCCYGCGCIFVLIHSNAQFVFHFSFFISFFYFVGVSCDLYDR